MARMFASRKRGTARLAAAAIFDIRRIWFSPANSHDILDHNSRTSCIASSHSNASLIITLVLASSHRKFHMQDESSAGFNLMAAT